MKTIYTIILVFAISISCCLAAKKQSSHGDYSYITKEYILNKDGSMVYNYSSSLKLLTYDAFHKLYGESFIVYNPAYQTLKINNSTTTMRDEKKVKSPQNAFNEVLPSFAANAPTYNVLKEMVVSHTGLEVGATIDFSYTLTTSKDYGKPFCDRVIFAESSPVQKYTVIVKVPKNEKLYTEQLNFSAKPVKTSDKNFDIYKWTVDNTPAAAKDQNTVPYLNNYKSVAFSNIDSFNNYFIMSSKPSGNINVITNNIVATTELDKSIAIADYIATNILTNNIPLSLQNKTIKTPDEVILTNSGTPIEKANLMSTILNYEGIDNKIVIAVPSSYYTSGLMNLNDIASVFVIVNDNNKHPFALSLTGSNSVNNINNLNTFTLINITPDSDKNSVLKYDNVKRFAYTKFTSKLNPNMTLSGSANITLKDASTNIVKVGNELSDILKYISKPISNASCTDFKSNSKSDINISFKYDTKDTLKNIAEGYKSIAIPVVKGGIDDLNITALSSERDTPYHIATPVTEQIEYTLTVPSNIKILNKNTKIEEKFDFGSITIEYKINKETIEIRRAIIITTNIIQPSQYPNFVKMMNLWNDKIYRMIYLK